MQRIAVVGTSGSGKTTLARALSRKLGLMHTELDGIHWQPNWTPTETGVMREKVAAVVLAETWVIDGNYSKVQPLILSRADTPVWLDFPLWVNLFRLLKRTMRRIITGETLWNDCRETLRTTFSRDSIFVWAWTTHAKNRVKYARLVRSPEYAHLTVVHLRSPREAARWLAAATAPPAGARSARPPAPK